MKSLSLCVHQVRAAQALGAALVLLGGCKDDAPAPAAPAPAPAPTFRQVEDEPPPPPEPEPEPEADAGTEGAAAPARTGPRNTGCEVKSCSEAPSSALLGALQQRGRQARRCYEAQLANDPSLSVKMSLNVKVGTLGTACSVSVVQSSNDAVARCVANTYRGGGYPASKGCVANVTVPLNFVPR